MKNVVVCAVLLCFLLNLEVSTAKVRHALGVSHRVNARLSFEKAPRFVESNDKFIGKIADVANAALGTALHVMQPTNMGGMPPTNMGGMPPTNLNYPPVPAASPPLPPPPQANITVLEDNVKKTEEKLEQLEKEGNSLELGVKTLRDSSGVKESKGIEVNQDLVNPSEVAEAEAIEAVEKNAKPKSPYTAPVILLLPPVTTPRDKLEFARAIALRAHMNSPEMKKARQAKLSEMQVIKGKTPSELKEEIAQEEKNLNKTKAEREKIHKELRKLKTEEVRGAHVKSDIMFLKEDLEKKDAEINIIIEKLERMNSKLNSLNNNVYKNEKKEEEEEGEEEEELL